MKNQKLLYIAIALLVVVLLFWMVTEAFHLLTAPSDLSVLAGVLLLAAAVFIFIKMFIFVGKKYFKQ